MTIPVLTFFNNKGGVGKTSLIYHLAYMFSVLGKRILVADLDPQANLTAAFLDEERVEEIWKANAPGSTIYRCVKPLADVGDIQAPVIQRINNGLHLIPGDVALSRFEDTLSGVWPASMDDRNLYRPMRVLSSFWQVVQMAAHEQEAEMVLVDIGPNLGAINRSVLVATDYVIIPLGADLFSLQGLENLGPTLSEWKRSWRKRVVNWNENSDANEHLHFKLPSGKMKALGYLCQQYSVRLSRPVKAYDKWVKRIPGIFRTSVLGQPEHSGVNVENDPFCLGTIKHYRSLVPMSQEVRKPIFNLTPADGAIGSHANAVQDAKKDFRTLARLIMEKMDLG